MDTFFIITIILILFALWRIENRLESINRQINNWYNDWDNKTPNLNGDSDDNFNPY